MHRLFKWIFPAEQHLDQYLISSHINISLVRTVLDQAGLSAGITEFRRKGNFYVSSPEKKSAVGIYKTGNTLYVAIWNSTGRPEVPSATMRNSAYPVYMSFYEIDVSEKPYVKSIAGVLKTGQKFLPFLYQNASGYPVDNLSDLHFSSFKYGKLSESVFSAVPSYGNKKASRFVLSFAYTVESILHA